MIHDERARIEEACRLDSPEMLAGLALAASTRVKKASVHGIMKALDETVKLEMSRERPSVWLRVSEGACFLGFNPGFVLEYLRTGEDVLFAVLHELMHRIRSDPQRAFHRGVAGNVACDLLVNAYLWKLFASERPTGFITRLYRRDVFPENILLPPDRLFGLAARDVRRLSTDAFAAHARRAFGRARRSLPEAAVTAAEVYRSVWMCDPTYDAVVGKLETFLPCDLQVAVLGDHSGRFDGDEAIWRDLLDRTRGFLGRSAGWSDRVEEARIHVDPIIVQAFVEPIRRALAPDLRHPRMSLQLLPDRSVVPFVGRREAFLLAAGGVTPLFFPNPVPTREEDENNVKLYIDVSGSTRECWSFLYSAILGLQRELSAPYYAFSNSVRVVSLEDVQQGRVPTTGGTDFHCIMLHAIRNRFRRILVVTDGIASLRPDLAARLQEERLEVYQINTEPRGSSGLDRIARQSWRIPRFARTKH